MELSPVDAVFVRMGAGENAAAQMSSFMVELSHTARILRRATAQSLVIMDELGLSAGCVVLGSAAVGVG